MKRDLCLVMPVYNEEACVQQVVLSWRRAFEALDISFLMLILNDGSKDNTAEELKAFDDDDCVQVINKTNSGHGPTILEGYRQAAEQAHWVFQCDSDDEMPAESFASLWYKR